MDWEAYWRRRAPLDRAVEELKHGDGASITLVIRHLTDRPRFLQSGYLAERMLRFVSRAQLSKADRAGVVAVASAIAAEGWSREAREARRLLARWQVAAEE